MRHNTIQVLFVQLNTTTNHTWLLSLFVCMDILSDLMIAIMPHSEKDDAADDDDDNVAIK